MANRDNGTNRVNTSMTRRTLILMLMCGIVAFIVLAVKLYQIQIRDHDIYESLAVEQQTRETTVAAARGTIYDRNMNILAMSANAETVYINPNEIEENDQDVKLIARGLSEILGVSYESIIEKAADTKSWYKTVGVKIEEELANEVRAFIAEEDVVGIHIVPDMKRYYPYSALASNVIGFIGTENRGLEGLESYYESTLSGSPGVIITATNANGTSLLYNYENFFDADEGESLVLTLDTTVQYYLEKYLQEGVDEFGVANGAIGIVMDVNTGEILGLASLPNYDLNNFSKVYDEETAAEIESIISDTPPEEYYSMTGEERMEAYYTQLAEAQRRQWRSKAVSDTYEPGSTFKIFTLAMAIEEGLAEENGDYFCGGNMEVLGRDTPVNCWRLFGHGAQTLTQAAQHSCNVAFVKIGLRVGAQTFYEYVEAFGFFDKTGIDLAGESSSIWWSEEIFCDSNNLSSLASASFGQTFNITPLQLITAVSCVANGGELMEPYIVKSVLDSDGNVIEKTEPTVVRRVISEQTSERVCEILEQVVGDSTEGTGKNAYIAGYRVAGKTGTGEKIGQNSDDYVVSFVGFAPADDPQVAVLVAYDSPDRFGEYYVSGGVMAAPTVGKILEDILPYIGVEPDYTEEELARIDISVPRLTGFELAEAEAKLADMGLAYKVMGGGTSVTAQVPAANATVHGGSVVIIYTEGEGTQESVVVPDVTGLDRATALARLENAGLYMKTAGTASDINSVVASTQSVAPLETVPYGSVIEVTFVDNNIQD